MDVAVSDLSVSPCKGHRPKPSAVSVLLHVYTYCETQPRCEEVGSKDEVTVAVTRARWPVVPCAFTRLPKSTQKIHTLPEHGLSWVHQCLCRRWGSSHSVQ